MANLYGSYDPNAEAQQDFGKLPTGDYVAQIIDSDMKPTNDNMGEYLELTYEVMDGPLKGRKHWERLNLKSQHAQVAEIANRQFASVREATCVANPRDSQELHYKPHVIRVENYPAGSLYTSGKKKGQTRYREEANIKAWKRLDGVAPQQLSAGQTMHNTAAPTTGAEQAPWLKNKAA